MGKKKPTPITINDVDYTFEDLTTEQQASVNHVTDLDRKIQSMQFNLDQLNVGREAFMFMLTKSLEKSDVELVD